MTTRDDVCERDIAHAALGIVIFRVPGAAPRFNMTIDHGRVGLDEALSERSVPLFLSLKNAP